MQIVRLIYRLGTSVPIVLILACILLSVSIDLERPDFFPERPATQVRFFADETIRYLHYSPDGFTLLSALIEYPDGVSEIITYHPDGRISERLQLYPSTEGQGVVKRFESYDVDGALLSERSNRPDGTALISGERLEDESYELYEFAEDGVLVLRHLVRKHGAVMLDERFRPDGTRESENRRLPGGSYALSSYREDGSLMRTVVSLDWYGNTEATYYYEDGVTPQYTFDQANDTLIGIHYRPDGTKQEQRVWDQYNTFKVTFYDQDGRPVLRQEWRHVYSGGTMHDELQSVHELLLVDASVKTLRIIYFAQNPLSLTRIWARWDRESAAIDVTFTYREDGTLATVERKDPEGTIISTEHHSAAEAIREYLPPQYTTLSDFPVSPVPIPYPENR